jgi:hypothetical protein
MDKTYHMTRQQQANQVAAIDYQKVMNLDDGRSSPVRPPPLPRLPTNDERVSAHSLGYLTKLLGLPDDAKDICSLGLSVQEKNPLFDHEAGAVDGKESDIDIDATAAAADDFNIFEVRTMPKLSDSECQRCVALKHKMSQIRWLLNEKGDLPATATIAPPLSLAATCIPPPVQVLPYAAVQPVPRKLNWNELLISLVKEMRQPEGKPPFRYEEIVVKAQSIDLIPPNADVKKTALKVKSYYNNYIVSKHAKRQPTMEDISSDNESN